MTAYTKISENEFLVEISTFNRDSQLLEDAAFRVTIDSNGNKHIAYLAQDEAAEISHHFNNATTLFPNPLAQAFGDADQLAEACCEAAPFKMARGS